MVEKELGRYNQVMADSAARKGSPWNHLPLEALRVGLVVGAFWLKSRSKRAKKDVAGKRLGGEGERLRRPTLFRDL